MRQVICWFVYIGNWFVYIGKNPRFTAFLDSNVHTRLAIVTENELGLAFPARNLPKKFRPDPPTIYLDIMVTNKRTYRHTDRQTNAGDYIIPRKSFRGDNNTHKHMHIHFPHHLKLVSCLLILFYCPNSKENLWGTTSTERPSCQDHRLTLEH